MDLLKRIHLNYTLEDDNSETKRNCSSLASARDLVRIFFSHLVRDSHQVCTVISVRRTAYGF